MRESFFSKRISEIFLDKVERIWSMKGKGRGRNRTKGEKLNGS
jgi:hypothetical protein